MITVKLATGENVNVVSGTVDAIRKGARKGESIITISGIDLAIAEPAGKLEKRLHADGASVRFTPAKGGKKDAPAEDAGAGDGREPAPDLSPDGGDPEWEEGLSGGGSD